MPIPFAVLALLPATVAAAPASAEDRDLDQIANLSPETGTVAEPAPPAPIRRGPHARLYVEDALTAAARRDPVVPLPPPEPYRWQNRTSVDAVVEWSPFLALKLALSDRVDAIEQQGVAMWSRGTARNELREVYASWQPRARTYLEAGRINVRNGVALGFNPTDFFRPRTLVGQASLDPSVLSRNRLGTLMVRAQAIEDAAAVSILYAPKLFEPSPIASDAVGVDPRFDATNAANRALATVSWNLGDLSAQALVYLERRRSKLGLALTRPLGQSTVAYAEWAGGYEADLTARATEYGRQTGTLPAAAPPPIPTDTSLGFRSDAAAGASWTVAARLTFNLEYHFHQGALAKNDWAQWFAVARANPALAPELWYVRGYANDQLEPATRHNVFVRVAWPNAVIDHLDVSGFAFVDLYDGSTLTQVAAGYALSDRWTFTLSVSGNLGSRQSERGSLPQVASGIAELVCYL